MLADKQFIREIKLIFLGKTDFTMQENEQAKEKLNL